MGINTYNEKPLHAAVKQWCAQPGARFEVSLDNYIIDLVQDDTLIEVQTGGFSSIRSKLFELLKNHRVRLVLPIAAEMWIIKLPRQAGEKRKRRKSPKRCGFEHLFEELVSFPKMITEPGFSLEVLLVKEDQVREYSGRKGWRRKGWLIKERRLIEVVDRHIFRTPEDMKELLPDELPEPFTTAHLAEALGRPRRLAQQMAYCLRKMDVLAVNGKSGNAYLYEIN